MWKALLHYRPDSDAYDLYVRRDLPDGTRQYVKPIEMAELASPHGISHPCMEGHERDAGAFCEALAQAAWDSGWRPQGFADHKNELTATRAHLEDMRRIAMAAVKSKFPLPQEPERP